MKSFGSSEFEPSLLPSVKFPSLKSGLSSKLDSSRGGDHGFAAFDNNVEEVCIRFEADCMSILSAERFRLVPEAPMLYPTEGEAMLRGASNTDLDPWSGSVLVDGDTKREKPSMFGVMDEWFQGSNETPGDGIGGSWSPMPRNEEGVFRNCPQKLRGDVEVSSAGRLGKGEEEFIQS